MKEVKYIKHDIIIRIEGERLLEKLEKVWEVLDKYNEDWELEYSDNELLKFSGYCLGMQHVVEYDLGDVAYEENLDFDIKVVQRELRKVLPTCGVQVSELMK